MAATLDRYLSRHLDDHVKELIDSRGGEEYEGEYESLVSLFERSMYAENCDIEMAHQMGVPRKALYRFGITDKHINKKMKEFTNQIYPK